MILEWWGPKAPNTGINKWELVQTPAFRCDSLSVTITKKAQPVISLFCPDEKLVVVSDRELRDAETQGILL
jgi:hypothetical protein